MVNGDTDAKRLCCDTTIGAGVAARWSTIGPGEGDDDGRDDMERTNRERISAGR